MGGAYGAQDEQEQSEHEQSAVAHDGSPNLHRQDHIIRRIADRNRGLLPCESTELRSSAALRTLALVLGAKRSNPMGCCLPEQHNTGAHYRDALLPVNRA